MDRWAGKVAVVTGASAGIGGAICTLLADNGMKVVGLARRPQMVDALKSEVKGSGSISSRHCDVSKAEDIAAAFQWVEETYGGVDVLVNNAGIFCDGQITDVGSEVVSEADIVATIDTNITGLVLCSRRAVASMKRRNVDGHIIHINSILGHYVPSAIISNVYPSTKYAVTAFGASLANELAHCNSQIKTTSISPGLVETALIAGMIERIQQLPRLQPRDIAAAVLWALSTPSHCNITELSLTAVGQTFL